MSSIGQQFKIARERKGVTQSEAAAGTRIKIAHIDAMERDDFSGMPAPAYAKGFIKIYADYLGLDPRPLLQEFTEKIEEPFQPLATSSFGYQDEHSERPAKIAAILDALRSLWPNRILGKKTITIAIISLIILTIALVVTHYFTKRSSGSDTSSDQAIADGIAEQPPDPYWNASAKASSNP